MDAILLLCDYAEAVNGKLYIMGGGWTTCPPCLFQDAPEMILRWRRGKIKGGF